MTDSPSPVQNSDPLGVRWPICSCCGQRIEKILDHILCELKEIKNQNRPTGRLIPILGPFTNSIGTVHPTPQFYKFPLVGGFLMAAVSLNTIQQFTITIQPVDAKGHPAKVDGVPTWLTDNPAVVALTPSADGLSCLVAAVGIPGTVNINVTADADLGAGVTPLVGTIDCEVTQAPATSIVLTPGAVSDQP